LRISYFSENIVLLQQKHPLTGIPGHLTSLHRNSVISVLTHHGGIKRWHVQFLSLSSTCRYIHARERFMPPRQKTYPEQSRLPVRRSAAQAELSRYSLLRFGVIAICFEQRRLS